MQLRTLWFCSLVLALGAGGCGDDTRPMPDAAPMDGSLADAMDDAMEDAEMDALPDVAMDVPMIPDAEVDGAVDGGAMDAEVDAAPDGALDASSDGAVDAAADAPPVMTCTDGVMNEDETDVDCGGPSCFDRCDDGLRCAISADCGSAVCIGGTCQPARCSDGIRNGMETGVDCGGPDCAACGLGERCVDMTDCAEGMCSGSFCVAGHCFNTTRDVNETDVDCGGPDCGPCGSGLRCRAMDDCLTGDCIAGFCRTAACANGALDAGEVDIDCGGECPGCADGTMCTMDDDCLSTRCDGTTCTSCEDGVQNGDETDVDCGGSLCRPCFGGESCAVGTDCTSGLCTDSSCEGGGVFYQEDFSTTDGAWTVGGTNPSWEYASPANTIIDGAFTGTSVWVTNATADYNSSERSWVESPPFDLSGAMRDPLLELSVIWDTESCCDEGFIELSVDGGTTWTKVGVEGPDWYNDTDDWWSGGSTTWRTLSTELTGAAGFADVRIRFHFDSDSSVQNEGFAFDDVVIREDVCNNGILDPTETDIDCGGMICGACTDGSDCSVAPDCESSICDANTCISCLDGVQNGDELAVDCGGPTCGACVGGTPCSDASICASGECIGGVCTTPAVFYEADFEGDDAGWVSSDPTHSWQWGTPAGTVISAAASGTGAWVTNLTGDYPNNENSYIESPPFDVSAAAADPTLSLSLNYITESCCDEGFIEMSVDGGTTWTRVLASATAQNWYNDTFNDWWDGDSAGWVTASTVLTGSAGHADVRLRVHLSSDSSSVREGFGIDDVRVAPPAPDLMVEILASRDRCDAGVVRVTNVGSAAVGFFDLMTNIDAVMATTRITSPLEPGASFEAVIGATTMIEAAALTPGDDDPSNDSATFTLPMPIVLDARYVQTFEMDDGGWVTGGTNSSWEWGTPSDSFISSADSGSSAWVTDLNADHNDDELSYLVSPCFDTSSTTADVTLGFSRIFDLQPTNDHAHVEFSVDAGATWNKLGAFGEGVGWYNDLLGDFWDGVSGATGEWRRASMSVPGSAGASLVRFRFVLESDGSTNEDGFGVDDVIITP